MTMTADCPVCGTEVVLHTQRLLGGVCILTILPHPAPGAPACWGSSRDLGWEDVRAAVEIAEELGDRLRFAAHP